MKRNNNVTFQDIADYTHFSKTTISRYFNNPDSLTVENQEKIAEALKKLNYKENKVARILANGSSEFIGLILPNMYLGFYYDILDKLLHTYETYGYKFLVFPGSEKEETERRYIQELLSYRIEGLIVLSHTIPSIELASYHVPIVSIEREDRYISSVNTDNYMGGVQATGLLYKNNCDVFIHLNSPTAEDTPAYGRIRGFLDTCEEHNLPHVMYEYTLGTKLDDMQKSIHALMKEKIVPGFPGKRKGIFCSSDTSASIILNYLFNQYGCLPDEYRIVGFDDAPVSREAVIPISTVCQQTDVIVETAMSLLNQQIENKKGRRPHPDSAPVHKVIPPILMPRETSIPDLKLAQ